MCNISGVLEDIRKDISTKTQRECTLHVMVNGEGPDSQIAIVVKPEGCAPVPLLISPSAAIVSAMVQQSIIEASQPAEPDEVDDLLSMLMRSAPSNDMLN